jgi:1,4-alpha-glucan branching enzyme
VPAAGGPDRRRVSVPAAGGPDGRRVSGATDVGRERTLRELLALQSSDWAFLADGELAGEYPRQRAELHAGALGAALQGDPELEPQLRGLAPWLRGWA